MHGRTWLSTATPTLRNAAVKKSRTDGPTTGLFSEAGQLGASIKFASVTMGWRSCHGPRPCGARFAASLLVRALHVAARIEDYLRPDVLSRDPLSCRVSQSDTVFATAGECLPAHRASCRLGPTAIVAGPGAGRMGGPPHAG